MAQPIRNYTPKRDALRDLSDRLAQAPTDHAEALLSAYEVLQAAYDHGALDLLRGVMGGSQAIAAKLSHYASTAEGIRVLRNGVLALRVLGQIDPAMLEAMEKALAQDRSRREQPENPPRVLEIVQLMAGANARRTLRTLAGFLDALGSSQPNHDTSPEPSGGRTRNDLWAMAGLSALGVAVAGFLIGRMSADSR
jgi:hypothetical protein